MSGRIESRLGSRTLVEFLRARKYALLLASLGLLIVLQPLLRATAADAAFDGLTTLAFGAALVLLLERPSERIAALILGLPTIAGIWLHDRLPGLPAGPTAAAFHGQAGLFLGFATAVVLRRLYLESRVTADSLCGAFCGYLLVGLAFGHFASATEILVPGSYLAGGAPVPREEGFDVLHFELAYFSFLTLTTIGYGDVLPVRGGARSLAVIEGIAGQFYLAVLVAELLARKASALLGPSDAGPSQRAADPDQCERSDGNA